MASSFELEIKGVAYRATPLNCFQQFHLFRKVAPFASLSMALVNFGAQHLEEIDGSDKLALISDLVTMANPVLAALADLPDSKAEDIVFLACKNVMRRQETSTGAMWTPLFENGVCNFSDIDVGVLLKLTAYSLKANLGDFLRGALTDVIG